MFTNLLEKQKSVEKNATEKHTTIVNEMCISLRCINWVGIQN